MSHPTGPSISTITSHPARGPNGQRDPAGGRHPPPRRDKATCSSGSPYKANRISQGIAGQGIMAERSAFILRR
ncbi:hypothetical protein [Azospirillum sp. TSA6c]|uniref:hypothetical protein n=1 Tax=unclassified Azospirillum TaxID=2630922 RepID=UPI0013049248|nr:hypothetical protein [Azospirillum sp. TSA6c]